MSSNAHVPVLLGPVLNGLEIRPDGTYVDGTFGRGGHSAAILQRLGQRGRLIAIDRDPQAITSAAAALANDPRLTLIKGDFAKLGALMAKAGRDRIDGLLLDLGVSSPQLDEAERGFSFLRDGPLDMRMDPESGVAAARWLETVDEAELRNILSKLGEETHARRIARAVVKTRENTVIKSTKQLADIVAAVIPAHTRKKHPATKTFQAIRIFINNELEQLEAALEQSVDILSKGGRLCVISFHSLEDRIVKRFIRNSSREAEQYRGMPNVPEAFRPRMKLISNAIAATADEIATNVRARSARLRIAERL